MEIVTEAEAILRVTGLPHPRLDAEILAREALGIDRTFLAAHPDYPVPAARRKRIMAWTRRRERGEPIQYITGWREFWKDRFAVTPDVLIPRPETELLVEQGAALCPVHQAHPGDFPQILDLAAGSGCVGLSLLRELPSARLIMADRSPAALGVAMANARRLNLRDRCHAIAGDGLTMFRETVNGGFNLILANPPYIAGPEFPLLPAEVRDYEPRLALLGGEDGLDCYRRWLGPALKLLRPGGHLLMEFGAGQWPALNGLLAATGCRYEMFLDLGGIPRVFHVIKT